jgi:predicted nuclease of predicted toxin-antitoxin system
MAGAPDEAIAAHARETQAALVSRDTDFADIRRYPPEQYPGIVVLRLPDDAIASEIVNVLERFVSDSRFIEHLSGRLAIVEPNRVRFRPPLE